MRQQDSYHEVSTPPKIKQQQQRKFGCPCGKKYLSYPALFTHVKTKHDGRAPGQLLKPKAQKPRGRPKLPVNTSEESQTMIHFNYEQQVQKILEGAQKINYNKTFQYGEGNETCKDMASKFLRGLEKQGKVDNMLICFMSYLKFYLNKKYQNSSFWQSEKPADIIQVSNQIVIDFQQVQHEYPLKKEVLLQLLFILFRWMYKNKWTDHKLIKKDPEDYLQNQKK